MSAVCVHNPDVWPECQRGSAAKEELQETPWSPLGRGTAEMAPFSLSNGGPFAPLGN